MKSTTAPCKNLSKRLPMAPPITKEHKILSEKLLSLKNMYIRKAKQIMVKVIIIPIPGINSPKLVPLLKTRTILKPVKTLITEFGVKNASTLNFAA
jgi:hypothetical protein